MVILPISGYVGRMQKQNAKKKTLNGICGDMKKTNHHSSCYTTGKAQVRSGRSRSNSSSSSNTVGVVQVAVKVAVAAAVLGLLKQQLLDHYLGFRV